MLTVSPTDSSGLSDLLHADPDQKLHDVKVSHSSSLLRLTAAGLCHFVLSAGGGGWGGAGFVLWEGGDGHGGGTGSAGHYCTQKLPQHPLLLRLLQRGEILRLHGSLQCCG